MATKPTIIKAEQVIESLLNNNEVLDITFNNGKPYVQAMSTYSIETIRNIINSQEVRKSEIFILLERSCD